MQANLQDMLNNVEIRYWDLYLAYRNLETAKVGRDSALVTWRIVYDKFTEATSSRCRPRPRPASNTSTSGPRSKRPSANLYDTENELRLLMGLAATDGRLIRPEGRPDAGPRRVRLVRDPGRSRSPAGPS